MRGFATPSDIGPLALLNPSHALRALWEFDKAASADAAFAALAIEGG